MLSQNLLLHLQQYLFRDMLTQCPLNLIACFAAWVAAGASLPLPDDGYASMFGLAGHIAPTTINKTTGRKVQNESDSWRGVGDATRVERRRDRRFLVAAWRKWGECRGTIEILTQEETEMIRHAMRKLRRAIGRIRELMVRSRMRAASGMPMALIVRDLLGLRVGDDVAESDDDDGNEPMRGSAASRLALLHRGSYVLARRIETAKGGDKTVLPGRWRVARVVSDVARKQDGQTGLTRRLQLVEGVAVGDGGDDDDDDDESGGDADDDERESDDEGATLEFVEIPGNVRNRQFGDVFPTPSSRHSSGLYVIEPQQLEHSTRGDIVRFTADQVEEFDRVARSKRWWDDSDNDSGDSGGDLGGSSSSGGGGSSSGGARSRGGGGGDARASHSQADDQRDKRAQIRLQKRSLG